MRVAWKPLLEHAASIVEAEPYGMTLRGLFYRLVGEGRLPNTQNYYVTLSRYSARARRDGSFPRLIDQTRRILRPASFESAEQALRALHAAYRHDRTAGQTHALYLGIEKRALATPLADWFDELGLPVLPLGGYASQTFTDDVALDVEQERGDDPRPAVLIYAGDFDPSGEDIDRDFLRRVGTFDDFERVALTPEQIEQHELPPQLGKASDPRAIDFVARHGRLVQVELDALPLAVLRELYEQAVERYFNASIFEAVREAEDTERERLPIEPLP